MGRVRPVRLIKGIAAVRGGQRVETNENLPSVRVDLSHHHITEAIARRDLIQEVNRKKNIKAIPKAILERNIAVAVVNIVITVIATPVEENHLHRQVIGIIIIVADHIVSDILNLNLGVEPEADQELDRDHRTARIGARMARRRLTSNVYWK